MRNCKTILQLATDFLSKHKVSRPRFVAETLLAYFLQKKRIELYMDFDRPLTEEELVPFRSALKRASTHEPFEYIIGEVEFFDCMLKITPEVLIPRQETEILLDLVSKRLDGSEKMALDLCAGSGCLAIGLKKAFPQIEIFGVDLSEEALNIAKQNGPGIAWYKGDLTAPVRNQKFDLVLCNPPYISEKEYHCLDQSVRAFEPKMALVAGATGVEFYERLANELPFILNPGAKVFFEIGCDQGEAVTKIFSQTGFEDLLVERDWSGHTRFFSLKWKENSTIL